MLTVEAAGKRLGVSRATAYQLVADGHLPSVRYPGCRSLRIDPRDLEQLIEDCKAAPHSRSDADPQDVYGNGVAGA